ncbi:hypothetical protein VE01_06687 [Pseudogymnoascus verrucosus]|uniref:Uncharacterized protein n=1 Tax=Pseudogymnoascus verrucosus TaxID=342668 RepID=A0A1B8GJE6_9PEZI|nr:uncharacterized protein VE01_06687 [Pseudogymnoascus verrucosus]OBT95970.1 hypothetical protein VE01_06687 [Pseudogymnoascus verrucosus]
MSKRKPLVLLSNISSTRDLCDFLGFYGTEAKNDLCRVPIPFHILLHSGGKTRQSFWEEGRFSSKSLQEFLPSFAAKLKCAPNDIERIKLVLRLKTREVEIEMEARNEDIWEIAMATFRDEIKRGKAKGEVKGVSVLVEPVMRKGGVETGGWDGDEEFDF